MILGLEYLEYNFLINANPDTNPRGAHFVWLIKGDSP